MTNFSSCLTTDLARINMRTREALRNEQLEVDELILIADILMHCDLALILVNYRTRNGGVF